MWQSTVRAVRAGLLVCPDESLIEGARLDGYLLRFNPDHADVAAKVNALLDAMPPDTPRCEAVLNYVRSCAARKH